MRAYIVDYPYPKSYHPLAVMVRQWARKESDEDWKAYVDQVFSPKSVLILCSNSPFLGYYQRKGYADIHSRHYHRQLRRSEDVGPL